MNKMGGIITKNLKDGYYIFPRRRKRRSTPYYVATVVINSKKFKKNFNNREDAEEWLEKTKKYKFEDFLIFKGMR